MITYELAKKLKEAGFKSKDNAYIPTLEELIEACGKETFTLWNYNKKWFCGLRTIMKKDTGCFTDTHTLIIDYEDYVIGNSPEEAVANLWLKLNKKNGKRI